MASGARSGIWSHPHNEGEAALSVSAWEKLSAGTILDDLTPEELYVVYCEVREAAEKVGVCEPRWPNG